MTKFNFQTKKQINFIAQSKYAFVISAICVALSIFGLFYKGLDRGIDFVGGILVEVQSEENIDMGKMRSQISALKLGETNLQSVGTSGNEMLIHVVVDTTDKAVQEKVISQIKGSLGDGFEYRRIEVVGPKVGAELLNKSIWAAILALVAIALYIWFRFEWQFSLVCLIALAHDLLVTVGLFAWTGLDFNMTVVAGLLSMAGYVTNDKVVNFDRVRENLRLYHKMPIPELLNKGLNEMLSRTLITSVTTLIMLVILIFFGGETLFGFSVCLAFGVIIGTYSSLYLAVPMLSLFDLRIIGSKAEETGPYAEASKYEMEAKKEPLGQYSRYNKGCRRK